MKIFVASDESGVFDVAHNSVYTYGGLILFSNEERENLQRKYLSIERDVKIHEDLQASDEAKATVISRLRIQDFAEKKVSSINSEQPVKCR